MGITERRERQKAELRDLILSASARIIANEGFDALTMRKIADAIEYSPATIYLHFASRDQIALELVRNGFEALSRHVTPAASAADPLERIRAIGRAYLDFAMSEPETYKLIFMEDEKFVAPIMLELKCADGNPSDGAFDVLASTVQDLIDRKIFRPLDAQLVSALLWSSLHGLAALKLSCSGYPFEGSIDEPGEALIDILTRGLSA